MNREFWFRVKFAITEDPGTLPLLFMIVVPWILLIVYRDVPWYIPTLVYVPFLLGLAYVRKRSMGTVVNWSGYDEWREVKGGE